MDRKKIIIDTSAYSAFIMGNANIKRSLDKSDEIFINPIILGELLNGFIMGKYENKNRNILNDFLASPRVDILNIDGDTSERYAAILKFLYEKGMPIPTNDIWIAATAMQFGLKVLTLDKHFLKLPQILIEFF